MDISKILGRSKSTITREILRNKSDLGYLPDRADHQYRARQRRKVSKIKTNQSLLKYIVCGLEKHWFPEQISGRMKREKQLFMLVQRQFIHISTITELIKMLPNGRTKKWRKPPHPADISRQLIHIKHLPKSLRGRRTYGHWEGDTIFFKHKKTKI